MTTLTLTKQSGISTYPSLKPLPMAKRFDNLLDTKPKEAGILSDYIAKSREKALDKTLDAVHSRTIPKADMNKLISQVAQSKRMPQTYNRTGYVPLSNLPQTKAPVNPYIQAKVKETYQPKGSTEGVAYNIGKGIGWLGNMIGKAKEKLI